MAVILVRHGQIDKSSMGLNGAGTAFAEYIARQPWPERLPIKKVLADETDRCVATVQPLAEQLGLQVETFSCGQGTAAFRNHVDASDDYVVICVRMEDLPTVLRDVSMDTNSADAYDRVWRIMPGGKVDTFKMG